MRNTLIVSLIASTLLVSPAGRAQSSRISDFDFTAAEQHLKELHVPRKSLHEAEQGPDGARGYGLPNPQAARAALPTPPSPPYSTELEWTTYYTYCAWDVIVRATHLDSTPILTSDKSLIYTASHFAVVDTIKSDVPLPPGQKIVAYRVGGEVKDSGERLRCAFRRSRATIPMQARPSFRWMPAGGEAVGRLSSLWMISSMPFGA